MTQVHLEVLRPWVAKKVIGYLGMEDDIIINMVMSSFESKFEFLVLKLYVITDR
jgi:hypothetical protein